MTIKVAALLALGVTLSACSTYKVREFSQTTPHGDQVMVTYVETEYPKDLFGRGPAMDDPGKRSQGVALCDVKAPFLTCKTLDVDLDGLPMIYSGDKREAMYAQKAAMAEKQRATGSKAVGEKPGKLRPKSKPSSKPKRFMNQAKRVGS